MIEMNKMFIKLPDLNPEDSTFEMALRVYASYNDVDMAEFVISDILDSLQFNYTYHKNSGSDTDSLKQMANIYFSIMLNLLDDKVLFRDPMFYKGIVDNLIKSYDEFLQELYEEFLQNANLDLPIQYNAILKLVTKKPFNDDAC